MDFFKKLFNLNSNEEKLKRTLKTIQEANAIIAQMNQSQSPPPIEIFIKALEEIEETKYLPSIEEKTKNSLETFQKTCVQMIPAILHAEGLAPFQKGDYKKTIQILEHLRKFIVKYCELLDIERTKLVEFLKYMSDDFAGDSNEAINPKTLNPARMKYQEEAQKRFTSELAISFIGMLIDAIVITVACKAMIK